jgi:hypothetical protein
VWRQEVVNKDRLRPRTPATAPGIALDLIMRGEEAADREAGIELAPKKNDAEAGPHPPI